MSRRPAPWVGRAFGSPTVAALARWVREALYLPTYLPPVTALVAGRDGTVWLRREEMGQATVDWMVMDARGEPMATLEAPPGLEVLLADAEHVWGVEKDDLDVPYVVRYRVVREP